jgi:hypothetical protein
VPQSAAFSGSQVQVEVHALVKDAHDINFCGNFAIEYEM